MEISWHSAPLKDSPPAPLQQSAQYGAALGVLGRRVTYARITQNKKPLASAQIILRNLTPYIGLALLPRGPLWHGTVSTEEKHACLALLSRALPLPRLRALIINSEYPSDAEAMKRAGHIAIVTPQHMAELDLTLPKEQRLGAQTIKWRNRLRVVQKSRLKVSHAPFPDLRDHSPHHSPHHGPNHWLLQQDARQRRVKGYRALPAAFTTAYVHANPKSTQLFTATYDGTIVAAMLFLQHGSRATYHIGWTSAEGRLLSAHNLVLWEASNWLARHGASSLDLGIIDTENAAGLARFKIGTGAQIRPLGATWLYTPLTAGPAGLMAQVPRQYLNAT